ncbi:MAG: hypothetical protein NT094_05340 [Candidatus Staskawiczbacteria bacterium]|nr:hypothetical protein [Candidatus Staskawiczbacteria bacterium]
MKQSFQDIENEIRNETENRIKNLKNNNPELKAVYVPMPLPNNKDKKVEYIFIAMEPSFGKWAKGSEKEAKIQLDKGFKNFLRSGEDFCFNYAIFKYLSPSYYLTDISRIAMSVKHADELRKKIYPECLKLLKKEMDIIGLPNVKIFLVGYGIKSFLNKDATWKKMIENGTVLETIPHYSTRSSTMRKIAPLLFRKEFNEFSKNIITEKKFQSFIQSLLKRNSVEKEMVKEISDEYQKPNRLTKSRKELIFTYKKIFESLK